MRTINPDIIFTKGYNPKTVFLTEYRDLEARLDPLYYSGAIYGFLDKVKFPLKALSEISEYIKTGFAVGKEAQADDDSEKYIHIRPTNMGEHGELKFDKNIYVGVEYLETKKDQLLKTKDVLFNNTNSQELVGKTCFFNLDGIYFSSNHITRIRTNSEIVLPEYLCWILNYYQQQKVFFNICTNWNNQSGIGNELLKKIKIPIPPISVQKGIVSQLNDTSKKRRKSQNDSQTFLKSIDNYLLKELGITLPEEDNSIENRIFTKDFKTVNSIGRLDPKRYSLFVSNLEESIINDNYPKQKLSDLIIHKTSGDWGVDEELITNLKLFEQCLVIRATEFDNDFNLNIDNSRLKYRYILKSKLKKLDIQPLDILIEKSGGSENQPVGRVAIIEKHLVDDYTLCFSNFVYKIRANSKIVLPYYLFYYLKMMHNIKYTDVMQSQTNGIRNLIMKEFFVQEIPLPPMEKQKEIIATISKLFSDANKNITESEILNSNSMNEIETILKS
jgi:restriction endonuclease S subunit